MRWKAITAALGALVVALLGFLGFAQWQNARRKREHAVELAEVEEEKQQSEAAVAISEVVVATDRELAQAAEEDRKAVEHATETQTLGGFLNDRIRDGGGVRKPE